MSILNRSRVYLAGPIDHAVDGGSVWRNQIKLDARQMGVSLIFLDPTNKPSNAISEIPKEKLKTQMLKEQGRWDDLSQYMKTIVRQDLRMVDKADFIIAMVDVDVPMCGTIHEVIWADSQKKPVLIIVPRGKHRCPNWLFGICNHKLIFESVDECLQFLKTVDAGEVELDSRWVLMENYIN